MQHSTYVLCKVVQCQLIMNIIVIECKQCTLANVMSQTCALNPKEVPPRRSHVPVFPTEFPHMLVRSQTSSHTCCHVPIQDPMNVPTNVHGVLATFTYTFPCSLWTKVFMFCNFGTPKSPIMFNIMLHASISKPMNTIQSTFPSSSNNVSFSQTTPMLTKPSLHASLSL
jgi:hypothetical protein